jgi:oligopeptide/dipeptide ABC transporter ATP-binding protein
MDPASGDDMTETEPPLLEVDRLTSVYRAGSAGRRSAAVRAVDDVSFTVLGGETLGVVGESGCGKSSLARTVVGFKEWQAGRIVFNGLDLGRVKPAERRKVRPRMQLIVQDPYAALDPRMRVRSIVIEPLRVAHIGNRASRGNRACELLDEVGLPRRLLQAYPRELSGGQAQRIGIARALCADPRLLVCDEVVSALDVSVQAHILNLLREFQSQLDFGMIFISHDIAVTLHMCDRIAVMYAGKIVEIGPGVAFSERQLHPYSRSLLAASLSTRRGEETKLDGEPPNLANPPSGCRFHPRCPLYRRLGRPDVCNRKEPKLIDHDAKHAAACHFAGKV